MKVLQSEWNIFCVKSIIYVYLKLRAFFFLSVYSDLELLEATWMYAFFQVVPGVFH